MMKLPNWMHTSYGLEFSIVLKIASSLIEIYQAVYSICADLGRASSDSQTTKDKGQRTNNNSQ
ncbi:MAG: hypothetical protein F6K41_35430 [Symploca sp. SIO3E6]|nr:hypothetical protein [Caldora sp. SIO3E6]